MTGTTILARGLVARGAGAPAVCSACGQDAVIGEACPDCRQRALPEGLAGTLTVAASIGGRRCVVTLERSPEGGWTPRDLGRQKVITRLGFAPR